ncbi:MAG: AAA family ATPase [Syntrophales bacterium]|jgi:general secretion pathway protein A|nr:AAA family ATPase [Syntrophales bacterium]MCK9528584.1 AAA family ATPase [Syntrophales bacterium]MDX9922779.1 AAA family ATPase [Syntrophales bacterium]
MEYYRILNLVREPFSNSPEPDFFYESRHHVDCLQKLEVALRLRRGLNVVIGQVGAGKTTLSRQLIRKLSGDPAVRTYLLLDPHFSTGMEFLTFVAGLFGLETDDAEEAGAWRMRERIKNFLFQQAVEEQRLIVLIIDEGQKIPDFALESLRELLNYETNEFKLLQIAIFAQEEFRQSLDRNPGFTDRINLLYSLGPLSFSDTEAMVRFRVRQATERGREVPIEFTKGAMRAVYRETRGYPRKIVRLCHQVLLALIIHGKNRADRSLVKSVIRRAGGDRPGPVFTWARGAVVAGILLAGAAVVLFSFQYGLISVAAWTTPAEKERPAVSAGGSPSVPAPAVTVVADSGNGVPEPGEVSEEDPAGAEQVPAAAPEETIIAEEPVGIQAERPEEPVTVASLSVIDEAPPKRTAALGGNGGGESRAPAILGHIRIARNQFLGRAMREVYGYCDEALLGALVAVNPRINDPDFVLAGDLVAIPAIPAVRPEAYRYRYWVRIADGDDLEEMNRRFRAYQWREGTLRMVSYWTGEDGLRFSVVMRNSFPDEASARFARERLPADMAASAEVFAGWPPETLFFGDL